MFPLCNSWCRDMDVSLKSLVYATVTLAKTVARDHGITKITAIVCSLHSLSPGVFKMCRDGDTAIRLNQSASC